MANILIVSGSYFPNATANAVCAKKFEDKLREKGHNVIYCNRKHDIFEDDHYFYNGTEIYTVGKNSDLYFHTIQKLESLKLPNKMGPCFRIASYIYRILNRLVNIFKSESQLRESSIQEFTDLYAQRIKQIVVNRRIDLIISVSFPIYSHIAVKKALLSFSESAPFWLSYSVDLYWSNDNLTNDQRIKNQKEEYSIFELCDKIVLLNTIMKDYESDYYKSLRSKIVSLPLPLFDISTPSQYTEGINRVEGCQNWLFAGAIYDKSSTFDALIALLKEMRDENIVFHIMGKIYPKSQHILENLARDYPNRIVMYGVKPYEFAKGSMQRADLLVNLGNDVAHQLRSKIFEYMSCLKPILNIYSKQEDVGALYLSKYPLAYNLFSQSINDQVENFKVWRRSVGKKNVTIGQLRLLYKDVLSENVTESFYQIVKPVLEQSNE